MIQKAKRGVSYQFLIGSLPLISVLLAGCHSRFVEATIDNQSASPLHLIEVDYPSASFGVGNLGPKSQFHYHFKIQGSGTLKLEYTDDQGQVHTLDGPQLDQGQEGSLVIAIDPSGRVAWKPSLTRPQ